MAIVIYHSPRSRSQRIVWLCEEMGLDYVATPATFMSPSAELLAANPLGTLPAIEDGEVKMGESVAIMLYILAKYGPTPLAPPPSDPGFGAFLQLLVFGEASMAALANSLIATRFAAPADERGNWTEQLMQRAYLRRLAYLASRLETNAHIAGEGFTAADISVAFAIGVTGSLGLADRVPASVADYYARITARPAFARAMANG